MGRRNWGNRFELELPTFDIQLRRKRSGWVWLVCTEDGRQMMRGSEATRATAAYNANRALFLLLSAANPKSAPTRKGASACKFGAR